MQSLLARRQNLDMASTDGPELKSLEVVFVFMVSKFSNSWAMAW